MYKLVALFIAASLAHVSRAQDTTQVVQPTHQGPPAETPLRFYLTGSRGVSKHVLFHREGALIGWPSSLTFGLWRATAGAFITPRLALETHWLRYNYQWHSVNKGTTLTGVPTATEYHDQAEAWGVPLTLRYRLAGDDKERLQLEVLAGAAYVQHSIASEKKSTENGAVTEYRYTAGSGQNVYAMLGLGGRFRLTRHLELVADYGFNRVVKNVSPDTHRMVIGNPTGLTRNRGIGLRYRFNFRLPPKKAAPAG